MSWLIASSQPTNNPRASLPANMHPAAKSSALGVRPGTKYLAYLPESALELELEVTLGKL